uniref:Ribonuclease H-like domain-containing protein n=1 Tax=Tanacetum cinerariifolium TaxID=118510 RepID=A0A6L2MB49_TANCI|nr:ribonuclease H-like domain-containing protein [Tanacetum cinerariifolium]
MGTLKNNVLIRRRHLVRWLNRTLLGWFSVSPLLSIGRFINSMSRILFSMTPVDTKSNLGDDGTLVSDPTLDRSLARALHYLTFTRPGYCVFLSNNLLSWSSKRQYNLSCFSVEAGYRGVANVVAETSWLRNLLRELQSPPHSATIVYCDNVSKGQVCILHVLSRYQYADICTKGFPSALFDEFQTSLSVLRSPAPTARAISGLVLDVTTTLDATSRCLSSASAAVSADLSPE